MALMPHDDLEALEQAVVAQWANFGRGPGAPRAQRTLRHKTQRRSFQVVYWVTVMLNCAALGWLLSPTGLRSVKSFLGVA